METNDLRTFIELRMQKRLRTFAWARSLWGVDETAWWAADDPKPFFAAMNSLAGRGLARVRRQRRERSLTGRLPSVAPAG